MSRNRQSVSNSQLSHRFEAACCHDIYTFLYLFNICFEDVAMKILAMWIVSSIIKSQTVRIEQIRTCQMAIECTSLHIFHTNVTTHHMAHNIHLFVCVSQENRTQRVEQMPKNSKWLSFVQNDKCLRDIIGIVDSMDLLHRCHAAMTTSVRKVQHWNRFEYHSRDVGMESYWFSCFHVHRSNYSFTKRHIV